MATLTKKMTKEEIIQLKNRLTPFILNESTPQYTYYQIKTKECTITAYTSGKVVFQGADLSWLEPEKKEEQPVKPSFDLPKMVDLPKKVDENDK